MALTIRSATEQDTAQILAIYQPIVETTVISFELEPPSLAEMEQRIATIGARFPWLVCEDGNLVLGYAYATAHRARRAYQWSVDVSVYVHERARRKGVARALYTALFKILVVQGFFNAYAVIALPNPASIGLHEALGFRPVGVYRQVGYKLGAWHDVGWWQLRLQDVADVPQPPLDIAAVRDSPEWRAALATGQSRLIGGS